MCYEKMNMYLYSKDILFIIIVWYFCITVVCLANNNINT